MNALSCGPKASTISGISDAISPRDICKNPRSMYARVPHGMAQFVLKIEKLSHIMGTTPILEMARAYSLRPRLWLLLAIDVASARKEVFSVFKAKATCYDGPGFSCVSILSTDAVNSLELNILSVFLI